MYRKIKFILIVALFPLLAHAQLEADNWVFSIYKYVNFNRASQPNGLAYPQAFIPLNLGSTTYSDKNGQLLFFSDGHGLHNRTFEISPATNPNAFTNGVLGAFLLGSNRNFCQTVLAVPYPAHDSLFILFHINYDIPNGYKPTLLYSIVNMNQDSGRGDVDRVQRNLPVFGADTNVLFKLTAILHCNKKDIWVVGHLANSDKYFSLPVTAAGVNTNKIFSTGSDNITTAFGSDSMGHPNFDGAVKVSPLGNRIAAAFRGLNYIELGDFNTQTGLIGGIKKIIAAPPPADTIYNPTPSHRFVYGPVGVEFSPTGDRLYTSSNYEVNDPNGLGRYYTSFYTSLMPALTQPARYKTAGILSTL